MIAKDYVPPWARGDVDYYQVTVCRSIPSLVSRVPGLVWVDGEEVVGRVGGGQVVFVTQVQDTQLASGADLASESWRSPYAQEDQQATGQQQSDQSAAGGLQSVSGSYGAAVEPEALFAVPEILLRLHPLAIHPHRLAMVGERRGQIPRLPMSAGPIEHQIDDHRSVGPVKGLRPEQDRPLRRG